MKARNIGMSTKAPRKSCSDKNCPYHGFVSVRGREFSGMLVKTDAHRSGTVEWSRLAKAPKFERFEKRKTRIRVHNPACINANKGDRVRIVETRPISKSKKFVIIQNLGTDVLFKQREEALEQAQVKTKEAKDASSESKSD